MFLWGCISEIPRPTPLCGNAPSKARYGRTTNPTHEPHGLGRRFKRIMLHRNKRMRRALVWFPYPETIPWWIMSKDGGASSEVATCVKNGPWRALPKRGSERLGDLAGSPAIGPRAAKRQYSWFRHQLIKLGVRNLVANFSNLSIRATAPAAVCSGESRPEQ